METRRAGPLPQRRAVVAAVLTLIAAGVAIFAVQRWFNAARELYGADALRIKELLATTLSWSIGAVCVLALALGVNLWRLCSRVRRALEFQASGAQVIGDTVVQRGRVALRRSKVLQVLGVAFILCMFGLLAASWRLQSLIGTSAV
jgi:hypothetical protein